MAKIVNLVSQRASEKCVEASIYLQIAEALRMDVGQTQSLIAKHGCGYIYSQSGLVVADSPKMRNKMVRIFGTCVVINELGYISVKTPESIGRISRYENKAQVRREKREYRDFLAHKREERKHLNLFRDGQGKACPKHQGRANSHDDIGKYKYVPATFHRPAPAQDVFVVIKPKY